MASEAYLAGEAVRDVRELVVELCRHFYAQGWVTGTGSSITVKANDPVVPLADQLIVMSPSVGCQFPVGEEPWVDGKVLSAPVAKPWPHKPPKCTDCAPLFMKVYLMRGAGAVIHSHGMETCIATMLDPGAKEFRVCGPVKSWKRAEIPVDGTSGGFGFCKFESAEGSLRAMRLLSKLNIDGQELVLNINKATREYLEKDDEKKTTKEKVKEAEAEGRDGMVSLAENENDSSRTVPNVTRETGDGGQKNIRVNIKGCWNVTAENSDVDKDSMWKIRSMIEERMKSKLPGPPTSPAQISAGKSGDEDTKKRRQRSSAVKERKSRRVCEKEEELEEGEFSKAEMEAMGLQHWKEREVATAVKSSLQIDVASSMHVSMERGSTVEDERKSQHRARDGFHKKNDEEMSIVPGLVSDKRNSSARVGPFGLIGFTN